MNPNFRSQLTNGWMDELMMDYRGLKVIHSHCRKSDLLDGIYKCQGHTIGLVGEEEEKRGS